LKDVPNVVFAEIDNAGNEVEGIDIKNTPVLKFFAKGGDRKPVDFEGNNRDLDTLKQWIGSLSPKAK
jgi:hypothetical protein